MVGCLIRRICFFSEVVDLRLRNHVTARAIFSRWQIFAGIVLAVPGRAQRVFVDREVVDLGFAMENADEFVVRIKNPEAEIKNGK